MGASCWAPSPWQWARWAMRVEPSPSLPQRTQSQQPSVRARLSARVPPSITALADTVTEAAAPTNAPAASAEAPVKNGMQEVGFDKLAAFNYVVPEYTGTTPPPSPDTNQIPANIKAYDGRKVAIKGFMLPLKVKEGKVTELLLMRDQSMCCFGAVPKINEFLTVKMVGEGTKAVMDQAVTLVGTLKVGEFSENGYLLGIYQMDGERAEGPGL